MGFRGIKGFGLGKTKDTNDEKPTDVAKVVQMKDTLDADTKSLEENEQKLTSLIADNELDSTPGPHGPIGELSLDTENSDDQKELDDENTLVGENEPIIKVVEMTKKNEAVKGLVTDVVPGSSDTAESKVEKKPESSSGTSDVKPESTSGTPDVKPEIADDSLGNLFSSQEEEVNPLANLINSLPDVSVQELIDDLGEIKGIIKEWQKG
jgi:hypothetical protein